MSDLVTSLLLSKGQTIEQLRNRLQPQATDREAAKFMIDVVDRSTLSWRSRAYDYLQFRESQIPYKIHT